MNVAGYQQNPLHRPRHPGRLIRLLLEERGWTQDDLSRIAKVRRQTISNLIAGKSSVSPEMALKLATAFGNAATEWLRLDNEYQLSLLEIDSDLKEVAGMRALHEVAPVRDMERRGWINVTETPEDLHAELSTFFEGDPLAHGVSMSVAARRSSSLPKLSPTETAWCFRVRQLARTMLVNPFHKSQLGKIRGGLRRLATHPKEARRIPKFLAENGIRLVVVEPLPGARIDGAALWDEIGPIIALSIRHDRIDGFWFTLMHEFEHIRHEDPISVDSGMIDGAHGVVVSLMNDVIEDRANAGAATDLIASAELDSFIRRVGPLYSRERIIQFANRIKIHPGIIVGQLQHRRELGYTALRDFLVKIREDIVSTALTDGWGHSITPSR